MSKGFDCWGLGPSAQAAKEAGFAWRTWYSSFDSSKDGPGDGPALYAEQGIWSFTNFETTIDRVLTGGYAGGQADMAHAIAEYGQRGMPEGAAVALSADESIPVSQFPAALRYFQGCDNVAASSYLTATYGEQALIAFLKNEGAIQIGWRSMSTAWPGGASTQYCDLVQTGSTTLAGVEVDLDEALVGFFGQWQPGRLPSFAPLAQETDMQWIAPVDAPPGGTSPGIWGYDNGVYFHIGTPQEVAFFEAKLGVQESTQSISQTTHQSLLARTGAATAVVDAAQFAASVAPLLPAAPSSQQIAADVTARLGSALSNG
jgi:hypothetical protein